MKNGDLPMNVPDDGYSAGQAGEPGGAGWAKEPRREARAPRGARMPELGPKMPYGKRHERAADGQH
jgi:hypothetical protein